MARQKKSTEEIPYVRLKNMVIGLLIRGPAMIQNCFHQKIVEAILKKHMGLPVAQEPKVPSECIDRATVRNMLGEVCIPPNAIKKAIVASASGLKGITKVQLRQQVFIDGSSVPITYFSMVPRMDVVRINGKTPDIRFRPMFLDWSAFIVVTYPASMQPEMIVDLVNRAGQVGVGEWRPERDGTFGTYSVIRTLSQEEINETKKRCAPQLVALTIPDWAMNVALSQDVLAKIAASDQNHKDEEEGVDNQEEVMTGDKVYEQVG
jgi:hypothetical protein